MLILFIFSVSVAQADIVSWKQGFLKRYGGKGVPKAYLSAQLKDFKPIPEVIEKDRNQVVLDTSRDYKTWIERWKNSDPPRVEEAKKLLVKYQDLLSKVENKYKVDKEVIISLWGVETKFGKITGDYPIIDALATLAYDGRRRKFFEKELFSAIQILYQGHIDKKDFLGSWAGATGQCQFMPSSFIIHAQDFNGDGKKDIWNSIPDTFASIAQYLKKSGWSQGNSIGLLAKQIRPKKFNIKTTRSPQEYNNLNLRNMDGTLIDGNWRRMAAEIPFKNSPYILRGSNYLPLIRWNNSSLFVALNLIIYDELKGL